MGGGDDIIILEHSIHLSTNLCAEDIRLIDTQGHKLGVAVGASSGCSNICIGA